MATLVNRHNTVQKLTAGVFVPAALWLQLTSVRCRR